MWLTTTLTVAATGIAGEVWQLCASLRLRLLTAALLLLRTVAACAARAPAATPSATGIAFQTRGAPEDPSAVARHSLSIFKHTCSTLRLLSQEQSRQQSSTTSSSSSSFAAPAAAAAGDLMDTDEPAVTTTSSSSSSSSSGSGSSSDSTEHLFSVCMGVLQELSVLRGVQTAALQKQQQQQQYEQYDGAVPHTARQLDKQWESVAADEGLVPLLLLHLRYVKQHTCLV
jgi:hypothetical protein